MMMFKKSKEQEQELLVLLQEVYSEVVTTDQQFASVLLDAYEKIDDGESYKIICTRISGRITAYVMKHDFKVSDNVVKLNQLVSEIAQRYRGWGIV